MSTLGDKINAYIASVEASHGRSSPLHNMGETFVSLQSKYGVNAAVVVGTVQKENQFGTVDDAIANTQYYNFGGNTCGAVGVTTSTGCVTTAGRSWDTFPNAAAGLEGVFQTLNASLYRATDGTLGAVMNIYSPPFENPDFWPTFAAVGSALGVVLNQQTKVYSGAQTEGFGLPTPGAIGGSFDSLTHAITSGAERVPFLIAGLAILGVGLWRVVRS